VESGRRRKGTCRPVTRATRNLPACTRSIAVTTLHTAGTAGANRLAFNGRARGRALRAGRYRLTATAAGDHAGAASRTFTVR